MVFLIVISSAYLMPGRGAALLATASYLILPIEDFRRLKSSELRSLVKGDRLMPLSGMVLVSAHALLLSLENYDMSVSNGYLRDGRAVGFVPIVAGSERLEVRLGATAEAVGTMTRPKFTRGARSLPKLAGYVPVYSTSLEGAEGHSVGIWKKVGGRGSVIVHFSNDRSGTGYVKHNVIGRTNMSFLSVTSSSPLHDLWTLSFHLTDVRKRELLLVVYNWTPLSRPR